MLKRTPFFDIHRRAGARLIDFGGFEMPVRYDSIKKEHTAVRERVGMFDVSHMGEFFIDGPQALDLIQYVTINDASKLKPGKAQYSAMCYEDGGIVDDLLVYMLEENRYMMVVNASNITKDLTWIGDHNDFQATVENRSAGYCLLAVQGPRSIDTLQKLTDEDLNEIPFYSFESCTLAGFDRVILSATGYTGERGFEIYFDATAADPSKVWKAVMEAGTEFGIEPCGLGARDTLRLEMGFALYGNDITRDTNPIEAGLGWLTQLNKGTFIGRDTLVKATEEGVDRKLTGFIVDDLRAIPRSGYTITDEKGKKIGFVTSGSRSITLEENIGMGYVAKEYSSEGSEIYINVRNKEAKATVTRPPFVKKK